MKKSVKVVVAAIATIGSSIGIFKAYRIGHPNKREQKAIDAKTK